MCLNECQCILKKGFYFRQLFSLKKIRTGRDQRFHHPYTVATDTALCFCDLFFCLYTIFPLRCDQVEILFTAAGINIGIAGIGLFGALVVSLDPADLWPFIFGKAHDGVLCSDQRSLRFISAFWDLLLFRLFKMG